ncbi:DUF6192 family protein [Saccharopolyspora spinosa]|uniref:RacO protein n=1 Tax=Saccharopolyspora spinosa TaxID=60894 RepID=A0A2N3XUY5_SACSN|nr:DUF6192 family protein [Saccharopolyspora spinosa]PKW14420.1 hypothetical protein A8926_2033 [Saccharopolyspora spinosa]
MATSQATDYSIDQWDELVKQGQRLTKSETSAQFQLGDIALTLVPVAPDGKRPPMKAYKLLANYANEIGQDPERFEEYRNVSAAWPKNERNKQVCWTVHSILAPHPDRFTLIDEPPVDRRTRERHWTCDAARRVRGWKTDVPETTEEKLRAVEDLLDDEQEAAEAVERVMRRPAVVRRVAEKQQVRETFNRAQTERIREAHSTARQRPEIRRLDEEAEVYTVLGLCQSFARGIGKALPGLHLAELSDDAKESIREGLERVTAAVEWTEHVLQTGQTDMDEALQRLIAGET